MDASSTDHASIGTPDDDLQAAAGGDLGPAIAGPCGPASAAGKSSRRMLGQRGLPGLPGRDGLQELADFLVQSRVRQGAFSRSLRFQAAGEATGDRAGPSCGRSK